MIERKALKDFTLPDYTFTPKGAHVAAIVGLVDLDEKIYEDSLSLKPVRFVEARKGADAVKNQMVTTSLQNLLFGHGRHAW